VSESSRSHLEKHSAGSKAMFLELNCLHVIAEAFTPKSDLGLTLRLLAGYFSFPFRALQISPSLRILGFPFHCPPTKCPPLCSSSLTPRVCPCQVTPSRSLFLFFQKPFRERAPRAAASAQDPALLATLRRAEGAAVVGATRERERRRGMLPAPHLLHLSQLGGLHLLRRALHVSQPLLPGCATEPSISPRHPSLRLGVSTGISLPGSYGKGIKRLLKSFPARFHHPRGESQWISFFLTVLKLGTDP